MLKNSHVKAQGKNSRNFPMVVGVNREDAMCNIEYIAQLSSQLCSLADSAKLYTLADALRQVFREAEAQLSISS
ncbi:hypothetical protein [Beijerinckia indica]|uniref:hypothetical protein n=1 Tax=Beijerinckia indica TaxID=533 RepID=UPI0011D140CB|nr:hypothetical protein [Beijerinckia indica]